MAEPPLDEPAAAQPNPKPLRSRIVSGKTGPQRLLLWLGAAATALLAIGTLLTALGGWLRPSPTGSPSSESSVVGSTPASIEDTSRVIRNQSLGADAFVQQLLGAADSRRPVQLNHTIYAPHGEGASIRLEYGCVTAGCSFTRLEPDGWGFDWMTDDTGAWVRGCVRVTRDGAGFGAEHLDLELLKTGPTCP